MQLSVIWMISTLSRSFYSIWGESTRQLEWRSSHFLWVHLCFVQWLHHPYGTCFWRADKIANEFPESYFTETLDRKLNNYQGFYMIVRIKGMKNLMLVQLFMICVCNSISCVCVCSCILLLICMPACPCVCVLVTCCVYEHAFMCSCFCAYVCKCALLICLHKCLFVILSLFVCICICVLILVHVCVCVYVCVGGGWVSSLHAAMQFGPSLHCPSASGLAKHVQHRGGGHEQRLGKEWRTREWLSNLGTWRQHMAVC